MRHTDIPAPTAAGGHEGGTATREGPGAKPAGQRQRGLRQQDVPGTADSYREIFGFTVVSTTTPRSLRDDLRERCRECIW